MYALFVIGTAGSGKSLLTSTLSDWLRTRRISTTTVNLDPAVVRLPYDPDVDVRDHVSINEIMEKYELGPNGSMVVAADLIATQIEILRDELEDSSSDYVVVDTPGQMELFAFRASGPYIAEQLTREQKSIIYLFDAAYSVNPLNYISNMFLAAAVQTRFLLPQIPVLTKTDLLSEDEAQMILDWGSDEEKLELSIDATLKGDRRILSCEMARLIDRLGMSSELIAISARTQRGFLELEAGFTRIFSGGYLGDQ